MIIDNVSLSLEDKVYSLLEEEILTGKLQAGEQLREIALTERLGASRTPIRGALHRLAEDGLLELLPNRGARVIGITRADIEDIYAIRMRLEGLASRLATERMSEESKRELASLVELSEFYVLKNNDNKSGELDSAFHKMIYEASGSRHLCKTLSDLHNNIKFYRRLSLSRSDRAKESVAEHREILEAILRGDADEAERLTFVHVNAALENFKTLLLKM